MSTAPNQPENLQSDVKPADPSPDQPASESPVQPEEEEEEGECGFCLFMKGGGCKDTFVDWENCVKEAEDKKEDLVEKCSQITARLKQCMDSHSDYYAPILMAEKHAEEQAVIELEKEKQDSAANDNQPEAPSQSNQK
ncbi:GCK domain protein [Trifolium medium]|uniref:GCK domain protein n=1 Tax=Trifolium medium TaxID=97028 RepID=A0A392N911_9FABA|nr:GCK domain protein [Trifolium medium]